MKKFSGYKVKELREQKGVSQMELSMALGYKSNAISMIEIGKIKPSVDKLMALSDALECDINCFYS